MAGSAPTLTIIVPAAAAVGAVRLGMPSHWAAEAQPFAEWRPSDRRVYHTWGTGADTPWIERLERTGTRAFAGRFRVVAADHQGAWSVPIEGQFRGTWRPMPAHH